MDNVAPNIERTATISSENSTSNHFMMLDALRGLAAVEVVFHHIGMSINRNIAYHGYLAVDLFVMLSGFVMGRSYEHRLQSGMTTTQFLKIRVARLYPMIFAGSVLATFAYIITKASNPDAGDWLVLQFFLLPCLSTGLIFPANPPFWSLFFEIVANVIHALILVNLRTRYLAYIWAITAIADAAMLIHTKCFDYGFRPSDMHLGLVRISFDYSTGLLIFRYFKAGRLPSIKVPWPVIMIIVGALLFGPKFVPIRPIVFLALTIFPVAIIASLNSDLGRWTAVWRWLGLISYPLYAIHIPLISLCLYFGVLVPSSPMVIPQSLGVVGLAIMAATAFESWYDLPIRRKLKPTRRAVTTV